MSRFVWPYLFALRAGNLLAASKEKSFPDIRAKFFPGSNGTGAVALRWSSQPVLGFPREPFQVYRRKRNTQESKAYVTVLASATALSAQAQNISVFPGDDAAYVVIATITVAASGSVTVQAVDAMDRLIPNQVLTLTQSGAVEFRCPGIAALRVSGSGSVGPVQAIGEDVYANLPDWTQIQTVGLPFLNNEIGSSYNTQPQGFWSNPVTPPTLDGVTAAVNRTLVTAALELAPPATGIADFPLPAWAQPNPSAYVANIRDTGNLAPMIARCLENSVDTDPQKLQSNYSETITTEGLSQIGAAPPSPGSPPSQVSLPVTGVAMLAASTDSYAAVALGYGTLDIPPGSDTTGISIAVAPASATVVTGKTQQFTATVTGATNSAVLWSVNGVPGGNATLGTITAAGLYTAPGGVPATNPVTILATSAQDPLQSATSTVTISRPVVGIPIAVAPIATTMAPLIATAPPPAQATPASAAMHAPAAAAMPPAAPLTPVATTPSPAATATTQAAVTEPSLVVLKQPTLPPADGYGNFDYMVTAPYVFPFDFTITLAALSTGQPPVVAPAGLTASLSQVHAPLERDQAVPVAISITWDASADPQGYGILVSHASNQSQVLNEPRPAAVGGYEVFVGLTPLNPDPDTPPDQQNPTFSDVASALPLAAPSVTNRYLVAAQDIFGQWSNWVATSAQLSPPAVTKPALINAQFLFTAAGPGSPASPIVPASLRIDFGWDWQDRAPGAIRFTGQFVPAPASTLSPAYLGGFAMENSGTPGTPVILTFSYQDVDPDTVNPAQVIPTITSGHGSNGPVVILSTGSPPVSTANSNQVQYRVELTGIELDFSAADELDFLLYATATEEAQPGVWSDPVDQAANNLTSPPTPPLMIGRIVRAIDPNPPIVTFTPPPISWTALPDATGTARGVLEWQPDPTATGYYVWEATESALLHLLPPGNPGGTPDPEPGTPYPERATTLKNLLDTYQDASLQGFARLTQDPITGSSTEIALPGSAQTLYIYRISCIGANNVESARSSSVAIFAVPRRNVPGTPRIMLRSASGSPAGLQVIVLPVESSAPPAGYRLFRVRSQELSQNGSTMGPAKYDESSPLWQSYSSTTLAGKSLSGESILDTAAVPSWFPYYYRATAVGAADPENGLYSGESPYSSVQTGYVLPANPPLIGAFDVAFSLTKTAALVTLTTDLPAADASPVGSALVELLQLVHQGSPPGPLTLQQKLANAPNLISMGTLALPPLLTPVTSIRLARSAPDANGQWKLYILMPYSPAQAGSFVLRLTDPLARQSTVSF